MPSTSGIEHATTTPARIPRLKKLTARTIAIASQSALVNPPTASSTTTDWSATRRGSNPDGQLAGRAAHLAATGLDSDRQIGGDRRHLVRDGFAEDEVVAALRHRDRKADRRLAVVAEHR